MAAKRKQQWRKPVCEDLGKPTRETLLKLEADPLNILFSTRVIGKGEEIRALILRDDWRLTVSDVTMGMQTYQQRSTRGRKDLQPRHLRAMALYRDWCVAMRRERLAIQPVLDMLCDLPSARQAAAKYRSTEDAMLDLMAAALRIAATTPMKRTEELETERPGMTSPQLKRVMRMAA